MRVLVTGGRSFDGVAVLTTLDELDEGQGPFNVIIHGGNGNTDHAASRWAMTHRRGLQVFEADWEKRGKAAGPIRNQQMLDEGKPDLVVAFPGGRGTTDMVRKSVKASVDVHLVGVHLQLLTPDQVDEYQERAAIIEHDGGLGRQYAEEEAFKRIHERGKYEAINPEPT